jgi:23S rRNA U2552 (ribose-2'-O)-methylase RlmE/FtsJ
MMQGIGRNIDEATGAFGISHDERVSVLDLCMAPGGFVQAVLNCHPTAEVRAFSLPPDQGGHKVLLDRPERFQITFTDITMLAMDMGATAEDIRVDFPEGSTFQLAQQIPEAKQFDIVFCDGQVLRTQPRADWREAREANRLLWTQLTLGLQHVKTGGTMVILLHHLESIGMIHLLRQLISTSNLQLFKPRKSHATRSSFYAIAKNVRKDGTLAGQMVETWKEKWKVATFGTQAQYDQVSQV